MIYFIKNTFMYSIFCMNNMRRITFVLFNKFCVVFPVIFTQPVKCTLYFLICFNTKLDLLVWHISLYYSAFRKKEFLRCQWPLSSKLTVIPEKMRLKFLSFCNFQEIPELRFPLPFDVTGRRIWPFQWFRPFRVIVPVLFVNVRLEASPS